MGPRVAAALLAHEGGWDEILLVVGPIMVIAGFLLLAKQRIDDAAGHAASDPGDSRPAS